MEMKDMTLTSFCALTASDAPAPGGGSVSALAGALAASLAEMVGRLSAGRSGDDKNLDKQLSEAVLCLEEIREKLLRDISRDSESFNGYMEALRLPKDTEEQKAVRREAMQNALKAAAEVPLVVAKTAAEILPFSELMVSKGNPNAVTDGLVSAMMARTAVLGALYNVAINLDSIKDEQYTAALRGTITALAREVKEKEEYILKSVNLL